VIAKEKWKAELCKNNASVKKLLKEFQHMTESLEKKGEKGL
jgi:cell fate (sporulation/competence/biofilm development) regulator YlbF (YheA/YmcA/DUF963 family)